MQELHQEFLLLKDTPQDEKWHPEGDVWTHTLMTVDKTAEIIRQKNLLDDQALTLLLSALCHDLGKPQTTKLENGRYTSHGHEQAGLEPTEKFLKTLGTDNLTKERTDKLVLDHLAPMLLYADKDKVTDGAIRRLAKRLHPATINELILLATADHLSRLVDRESNGSEKFPAGDWLLARAKNLEVENKKPADIIRGRDLINLGLEPGPVFGEIIALANQLRDEQNKNRGQILQTIAKVKDNRQAIINLQALLNK
jgi:tRNA nucleotidyltransferase (CCA-adding enzyme)